MKVSHHRSHRSRKHSRKCNCKQCDMYYRRSHSRKHHRHRRSRNKKQNNTSKLYKPSPEIAYANDMSNKMVEVALNKNNNKSNDDAGNIIPGLRNI